MPIYLVRWPNLSAALVKASSEDELLETLDEIANSDGCTWCIYRGPIFLDLNLPATVHVDLPDDAKGPITPEQIRLENLGGLRSRDLEVTIANSETGHEMVMAIARRCFPSLHKLWDKIEEPTDAELHEAAMADLEPLVRAHWRQENVRRSNDPTAKLAAYMGMPVALARQHIERRKNAEKPPKP